jgi:hypothetical protein
VVTVGIGSTIRLRHNCPRHATYQILAVFLPFHGSQQAPALEFGALADDFNFHAGLHVLHAGVLVLPFNLKLANNPQHDGLAAQLRGAAVELLNLLDEHRVIESGNVEGVVHV